MTAPDLHRGLGAWPFWPRGRCLLIPQALRTLDEVTLDEVRTVKRAAFRVP